MKSGAAHTPADRREAHPYVRAAIDGEVARLSSAPEGDRNRTLFKSSASLASLGLPEGQIIQHLKPAADSIGLHGREFYSTIKSGTKAGYARPREIPASNDAPADADERAPFPPRTRPDKDGRPAFVEGDVPKTPDEVRRHAYYRGAIPVRLKIKRASGGYTNWYRVTDGAMTGWQAGKPDGYKPVPYVGPMNPFDRELMSDVVCWPEGEKDCDTLGASGLPAFTFGGTGDGLPEGTEEYVRDRHVVVLADNDLAGMQHAEKKATTAHAVAASVKLVTFSALPPKSDVSDYLAAHSVTDLQSRIESAPNWTPQTPPESPRPMIWQAAVISAEQLKERVFPPVSYVVPGYVPEGVTVFAGKPKIGKSWLLYDVCVASAGDRFVLGTIKPAQGDVLYLALEDSLRRLKRRLNKLCGNVPWPPRLTLATDWRRADAGGIDDIASWCDSVPKPVLVVIDTLEKFRQLAKPGSSAYTTDYLAVAALHKLAHQRGLAVVLIHHVRKMEADDPFDMVSGTNGLTGAADTILVLKRQGPNVTLFARGRDIEEQETACQFDKTTCRWTFLGDAAEVHSSGERSSIIAALEPAGAEGLTIGELMAATTRTDRNALDQLLFKMSRDGEVVRVRRGVYSRPSQ